MCELSITRYLTGARSLKVKYSVKAEYLLDSLILFGREFMAYCFYNKGAVHVTFLYFCHRHFLLLKFSPYSRKRNFNTLFIQTLKSHAWKYFDLFINLRLFILLWAMGYIWVL